MQEGATMRMVLLVMRADMIARSAINQSADITTFKPVRLLHVIAHHQALSCP